MGPNISYIAAVGVLFLASVFGEQSICFVLCSISSQGVEGSEKRMKAGRKEWVVKSKKLVYWRYSPFNSWFRKSNWHFFGPLRLAEKIVLKLDSARLFSPYTLNFEHHFGKHLEGVVKKIKNLFNNFIIGFKVSIKIDISWYTHRETNRIFDFHEPPCN